MFYLTVLFSSLTKIPKQQPNYAKSFHNSHQNLLTPNEAKTHLPGNADFGVYHDLGSAVWHATYFCRHGRAFWARRKEVNYKAKQINTLWKN